LSFTINGDLLSSGTLTASAGTITFGGANGSTSNIDGSSIFNNLTCIIPSKQLIFEHGKTQTINGTLDINGQATGTKIVMNSDDNTNRFSLQVGSAQTIYYVNVANSQVTGTAGNNITGRNSTKTGTNVITTGNPRWIFGIDISGTISGITSVVPVSIAVNGTVLDTQNSDASGNFTFLGVDVNNDDMLLIFVNDTLAHPSSLLGKVTDSQTNVSGLAMALNQISISDAGLAIGTSFTNTNLNSAKNADTDTLYTVSGSGPYTLTFADGITLFIPTGITYTPGGAVVADDVHINGAFTPNANSVTVHGDWDKVHGTFTSTGTVTFDTTAASILSGSTSFYNLTSATAGKTLTFTRGTTQTVTNALTLTGTTANPIIINDTGAGAVPKLTVNSGASQSINNVSVTNNDASGGVQLVARGTGSSLSGTTTNWVLGSSGTTFTWTGTASSVWDNPANWDLGLVPSSTDKVIIPAGTPHAPALSSDITIDKLTINTGETVSCGIYNLTITGDLIINGSLDIGSTTLTVGGNITGAGQTLIGVNPVVNATGYVGTFTSPLGINISGTLTMHAGGMTDNTSVSLNGRAGSFVWKENIPGFIITNGNIQNWFGQSSIRPILTSGGSALYSGGNFAPMMMPAAPVFLPAMPAGPAPAIPVAAPAPMPMAAPIPIAVPMAVTVPVPVAQPVVKPKPIPLLELPTHSLLPSSRLPVVPRVELPPPLPKPSFEGIISQVKFQQLIPIQLPVVSRVELPPPMPKLSFEGITSKITLQMLPSFEQVLLTARLPALRLPVVPRVELPPPAPKTSFENITSQVTLQMLPGFKQVLLTVQLPQPRLTKEVGGVVNLPPRPEFNDVIPS
ncbi:MAG: hypothetical protein NT088_00295, partial [Candidatus Omnitrophica bacterium]|nr:hypothetical protein [Candidatus Omnitrophota bacterium]